MNIEKLFTERGGIIDQEKAKVEPRGTGLSLQVFRPVLFFNSSSRGLAFCPNQSKARSVNNLNQAEVKKAAPWLR